MPTCFETGDPSSPICIIGEAPGSEEVRLGEPFVGPAGNILQQCLHASEIARAECYIVNVWEERVYREEDKATVFDYARRPLWTNKGLTELGWQMAKGCMERLAHSSANVYVPMGGVPLSLLTNLSGIEKWRGSILEADWGRFTGEFVVKPRKCIPAIHPASVLRGNHPSLYLIAADLRKAKRQSEFPELRLPKRDIIIDPSMDMIRSAFKDCTKAGRAATDTEFSRGHCSCFSLSCDPSWAISIPIVDEGYKPRWNASDERLIWQLYAELLYDANITKINQNITFDAAALLFKNKLVMRGRLDDPMIAFSVMNPFLRKRLDVISSVYTDEPFYKEDNGLDADYQIVDFPQHWHYNGMDSAVALECFDKLDPILDQDGYRSTYENHIVMLPVLIEMMVRGFKVNVDAMHRTRAGVQSSLIDKADEIENYIGRPIIVKAPKTAKHKRAVEAVNAININSLDQMKEYFYRELKLKPFTRDGKESVDDKALSQIFRRDRLPVAKALQEYRQLKKLATAYLDVQLDEDFRLRCSYDPRGTWTGRLSSSETIFHTGMNMQNVHPNFREFMEAG